MSRKNNPPSKPSNETSLVKAREALQEGLIFHQAGRLAEAVSSYRKAVSIKPDFAQAHGNLGTALKQQGELDEAISSYRQALSIEPAFAEAHYNLGNALKDQGKPEAAVSSYRQAVSIRPDFAQAHSNLGATLKEQGKLDEAISSYREAVSLNSDFARSHYNLGNALKQQGKLNDAVSSYRKAISISPDLAEAHYNLGNALKEQGKPDVAVSSYQTALSIRPDFAEAQHLMNSLLGHTTKHAPRKYVESLFNAEAADFENRLLNELDYGMPSLLRKIVVDSGLVEGKLKNVIDLGCGTGLCGSAFRDMANSMTGIDISENMVFEARKKDAYDALYVDEMVSGLESLKTRFDLFVAADVLPYIGDLLPLFNCVKKYSHDDSLFVFSTEHKDDDDFVLQQSGRYAHSKNYILSVSARSGLEIEYFNKAKLRKEKGSPITGGIYILRRKAL